MVNLLISMCMMWFFYIIDSFIVTTAVQTNQTKGEGDDSTMLTIPMSFILLLHSNIEYEKERKSTIHSRILIVHSFWLI